MKKNSEVRWREQEDPARISDPAKLTSFSEQNIALAPYHFTGNFYLCCFVNRKTIQISLTNAVNFS